MASNQVLMGAGTINFKNKAEDGTLTNHLSLTASNGLLDIGSYTNERFLR